MSIQSIIRWFEVAKPNPTKRDVLTQIGCHFEEVQEFIMATTHAKAKDYSDEVGELTDFYKAGNVLNTLDTADDVALLDALCDQVVTAIGVGVLLGYDMANAIKEVNRSNWTKFAKDQDGNYVPYIKPDGKIGKNPETYQEPQLADYVSLADRQQRAKDNLLAMLEQAESNTPAPYTSEKITVERIVTEVETYEIHPEQLGAFIDCADHRLEIDFGKPTGEFYSDKRKVLTTGRINEVNELINGD